MLTRALAALALACGAWGFDFAGLKRQGPLSDFANVVPPPARARVAAAVPPGAALVTITDLRGEPARAVARSIRAGWGVDVLVLVAIAERRLVVDARDGAPIDEDKVLERAATALAGVPPDLGKALVEAAHSVREQRGGVAPASQAGPHPRWMAWLIPLGALGWLGARRERKASGWSASGFGRT
jgi:hypothetical protein